jgi:hypothetical protein
VTTRQPTNSSIGYHLKEIRFRQDNLCRFL